MGRILARIGKKCIIVFLVKPEAKRTPGRPRRIWEDII
jgi:hypothetical protein